MLQVWTKLKLKVFLKTPFFQLFKHQKFDKAQNATFLFDKVFVFYSSVWNFWSFELNCVLFYSFVVKFWVKRFHLIDCIEVSLLTFGRDNHLRLFTAQEFSMHLRKAKFLRQVRISLCEMLISCDWCKSAEIWLRKKLTSGFCAVASSSKWLRRGITSCA